MRYAVLEYSTDLICPNYSIIFTSSKKTAIRLVEEYEVKLTHGNLAHQIKNYHHNLRCAYVLDTGFRKPTIKQLEKILSEKRIGSIYDPKSIYDVLAELIKKNGSLLEWTENKIQ